MSPSVILSEAKDLVPERHARCVSGGDEVLRCAQDDKKTRYEPIIVTTLRRYFRRGAPSSLLERLAGGTRHWRVLNLVYDLDGTAALQLPAASASREVELDDDLVELTQVERRIAIAQIADECAETGSAFPSPYRLGKYFGCDPRSILNDLRWMRVAEDPCGDTGRAARLAAAGAPA